MSDPSPTAQPGPPPGYPQGYPPGSPHAGYAGGAPTTSSSPGSTAALLAVSIVAALATGIIGIPSAIVAALAWRRNATDPAGASRRTLTGWIILAINFAVGAPLLIAFYIWASNNP